MKPSRGDEATEVCVKNVVRPRPGGRSARVRRAVLDVVVELLEEGGVQAVTIAEVATRSGVNASSIYRRWRGVDALILDAAAPPSALTSGTSPTPAQGRASTRSGDLSSARRIYPSRTTARLNL